MNALSPEEKQAWVLFDLSPDTDLSLVKKRYNELAKSCIRIIIEKIPRQRKTEKKSILPIQSCAKTL